MWYKRRKRNEKKKDEVDDDKKSKKEKNKREIFYSHGCRLFKLRDFLAIILDASGLKFLKSFESDYAKIRA